MRDAEHVVYCAVRKSHEGTRRMEKVTKIACRSMPPSSQHLLRAFQTISFQKNILSNSSCPASFSDLLLCFLKKLLGAQPFNKKCQF